VAEAIDEGKRLIVAAVILRVGWSAVLVESSQAAETELLQMRRQNSRG